MAEKGKWQERVREAGKQFEAGVEGEWKPDISPGVIRERVDVLRSYLVARLIQKLTKE